MSQITQRQLDESFKNKISERLAQLILLTEPTKRITEMENFLADYITGQPGFPHLASLRRTHPIGNLSAEGEYRGSVLMQEITGPEPRAVATFIKDDQQLGWRLDRYPGIDYLTDFYYVSSSEELPSTRDHSHDLVKYRRHRAGQFNTKTFFYQMIIRRTDNTVVYPHLRYGVIDLEHNYSNPLVLEDLVGEDIASWSFYVSDPSVVVWFNDNHVLAYPLTLNHTAIDAHSFTYDVRLQLLIDGQIHYLKISRGACIDHLGNVKNLYGTTLGRACELAVFNYLQDQGLAGSIYTIIDYTIDCSDPEIVLSYKPDGSSLLLARTRRDCLRSLG